MWDSFFLLFLTINLFTGFAKDEENKKYYKKDKASATGPEEAIEAICC